MIAAGGGLRSDLTVFRLEAKTSASSEALLDGSAGWRGVLLLHSDPKVSQ